MILYIISYTFGENVLIVYGTENWRVKLLLCNIFPFNNSHTDSLMKMGSQNSAFFSCVSVLALMLYSELTNIKH